MQKQSNFLQHPQYITANKNSNGVCDFSTSPRNHQHCFRESAALSCRALCDCVIVCDCVCVCCYGVGSADRRPPTLFCDPPLSYCDSRCSCGRCEFIPTRASFVAFVLRGTPERRSLLVPVSFYPPQTMPSERSTLYALASVFPARCMSPAGCISVGVCYHADSYFLGKLSHSQSVSSISLDIPFVRVTRWDHIG